MSQRIGICIDGVMGDADNVIADLQGRSGKPQVALPNAGSFSQTMRSGQVHNGQGSPSHSNLPRASAAFPEQASLDTAWAGLKAVMGRNHIGSIASDDGPGCDGEGFVTEGHHVDGNLSDLDYRIDEDALCQ